MNQLLRYVTEKGWNTTIYNILFACSLLIVIGYTLVGSKKRGLRRGKALAMVLVIYPIALLWMLLQCWIENGFKGWGGNNIVRTFVWIPVIAWPVSKLFREDWCRVCDFLAPCVPMIQVNHWGCIFAGCCHGYPSSWGVYNPVLGVNTFPVQFLEALVALGVVILVCRYEKKRNYEPDGLAYPLMLMLFGYSRFLLEFLRDNPKIMLGVSTLAIHALFMALVGTAAYFTIKEQNQSKANKKGRKKA